MEYLPKHYIQCKQILRKNKLNMTTFQTKKRLETPEWVNNAKTVLICQFRFDNKLGQVQCHGGRRFSTNVCLKTNVKS